LNILKGVVDLGTLTMISIMTLNFQSLGVTLVGADATVTRLVDVGVRRDDVGVRLGEESEPSDVVPVSKVTLLSADVGPEVPAL
jgi:hypothetical protein